MINSSVTLVPYVESFSTSNVVNASMLNWVRVINSASGTMVNLFDSNSVEIFTNVGYLQGTPYMVIRPSVSKFLLTSNTNMSVSITPTFIAINNTTPNTTDNFLYTIVAFLPASSGLSDGFYADRSFLTSFAANNVTSNSTSNVTHVTTGFTNATNQVTSGVAITAKATSGHVAATTGKSMSTTGHVTTSIAKTTATTATTTTTAHVNNAGQIQIGFTAVIFSLIALFLF